MPSDTAHETKFFYPPAVFFKHLLSTLCLLTFLYLTSLRSYLLFHTLAEFFSILIAMAMFLLIWNTRHIITNTFLLFLGIAYFFIAGIDLVHTISYKGMNIFPGLSANTATQLWICARYLEALSLILAGFCIKRTINPVPVITGYFMLFTAALTTVFTGVFPDCFIAGKGLTSFKIISEYIISGLLIFSLWNMYRNRRHIGTLFPLLACSIILTILSELAFTFYIDVYGFSNLVGHFFKIISFFLIYLSIINMGLKKPFNLLFNDLKETEERYRTLVELSPEGILVHDGTKVIFSNKNGTALVGAAEKEELIGRPILDFVLPEYREQVSKRIKRVLAGENVRDFIELKIQSLRGEIIDIETAGVKFLYENRDAILLLARNITVRKKLEDNLKKSVKDKEILLKEIHHRVKNNIQSMASMIRLHYKKNFDPKSRILFKEIENRIDSIAALHELLYKNDTITGIDFNSYLPPIINLIFSTYNIDTKSITRETIVKQTTIGLTKAVPLSLLIHELVSNSIKHAFSGQAGKKLSIQLHPLETSPSLKKNSSNWYELIVSDNGVGIGKEINIQNPVSIGLSLVKSWVDQLEGELILNREKGTTFTIQFPDNSE